MASRFFQNVKTLDELRSLYKTLLKKHHPDNGGDGETIKIINTEYKQTFEYLKSHFRSAEPQEEKSSKNSFAFDDEITSMLQKIITFSGIEIEICGVWIWIGGNSYPYREALKDLGFYWARSKKLWCWTPSKYNYTYGHRSMKNIRLTFGSEKVELNPHLSIE